MADSFIIRKLKPGEGAFAKKIYRDAAEEVKKSNEVLHLKWLLQSFGFICAVIAGYLVLRNLFQVSFTLF